MAYLAEIQLAVKGARQLKDLSDAIESTSKRVDRLARDIQTLSEAGIPRTINNLRNLVNDAADAFNKAALGTDEATAAAKKYVKATDELNAGLRERSALLEKITRQERAAAMVRAGVSMPAPQLLLPAARQGAPTMSGGARRRITGPVERLGGARTADEAAMALRFAQALQQQTRPLSQIESIYAGIASEAAKLQSIKALPDTAMLNASARGIKQLQTAENMLNTERQESVARLEQIDRLEASRARRARKLQERQQYMAGEPVEAAAGPGFGAGLRGRAGGAISSAIIGGGFPLLFGQGPAAAAGGALGGLAGGLLGGGFGFALSIAGTAIGDAVMQSDKLNVSLAALNSSLSSTGTTAGTTAEDIKRLARDLGVTNEEALKLVDSFSQFGNAKARNALASIFGGVGGASTFEALAKAGVDEKNALDSIFALRKQIGNESAIELALQLQTVGATQTQAALLKIVVNRAIEQAVAQKSAVQFADRLLSVWQNITAVIASAVLGIVRFFQIIESGRLIKIPFLDQIERALSGYKPKTAEQIALERGQNERKRLEKEAANIRKLLQQETQAYGVQQRIGDAFGKSKKAADEEARTLARIRGIQIETAATRQLSLIQEKIAEAEMAGDEQLAIRLRGEERYQQILIQHQKALEGVTDERIKLALFAQAQAEIDAATAQTAIDLEKQRLAELKKQNEEFYKRAGFSAMPGMFGPGATGGVSMFRTDVSLAPTTRDTELATMKKALDDLVKAENQVKLGAESIGSAFRDAFSNLVTGSMTAQEALAAMMKSIADSFADMAAQIIAQQLTMIIYGTITKALGITGGFGFSGAGPVSGAQAFGPGGPSFNPAAFGGTQLFAEGGYVTGPTRAVVGEAGDEYVIPASKMRGAMNRYAAGARGSAVIPAGGGGDGGTATMAAAPAAIDVRYTVERINSVDYVTADQFQRGMQQAATEGAMRGEQRALSTLRQNTTQRRKIGL